MAVTAATVMIELSKNDRWGDNIMLQLFLLPFRLIWGLIAFLFGLMGALLSIGLGLVLLIVGALLTMTIIGAVLGIPLILLGLGLVLFAFF